MLKNIGIGWVSTTATIVAAFVLMPFVYRTLGEEGYGTWLLILAIIGYLQQLLLGLPKTSVRFLAEDVASGDAERLSRTASTCAGIYLMMSAAALIIGAGLYGFFVSVYDIPPAWRLGSRVAFVLMVVRAALNFTRMLPQGVLAAHHDFVPREAAMVCLDVGRVLLTVAVLSFSPSLVSLALVQLLSLVAELTVLDIIVRRRYKGLRIRLAAFDWGIVRNLLSFSFYVMLSITGGSMAYYSDALIIGAWRDVSAIPFYATAASLLSYLFQFSERIGQVMMPMATALRAKANHADLQEVYMRWSKITFSLALCATLYIFVLGPRFLAWWIDPSFELPAGQVVRILIVGALFRLPLYAVAQSILMGMGRPRYPSIGVFVMSVSNIALSILLVGPLGLAGVALGTAIPQLVFAVLLTAHTCRELHVPIYSFVRYVTFRPLIGAVPSLALLLWFERVVDVRDFLGLATAGGAMVTVFALSSMFFVYWGDPYLDVRRRLAGYLRWA